MELDRMGDISIITAGTLMHLQQLSPFTATDPTSMKLIPNAASTLLALALLVALSKWRPIRGPPGMQMSLTQSLIRLLMEMTTITFMVEFLIVWIWIPVLMVLTELGEWFAEGFLEVQSPTLAKWFCHRYYTYRFILSASLAYIISRTQKWLMKNTPQSVEEACLSNSQATCNRGRRRTALRFSNKSTQTTNVGRFTIHEVTVTESKA